MLFFSRQISDFQPFPFLQFIVGTHPSQSHFQLVVPPTMQQICSVVGAIVCWMVLQRGILPTVNCRSLFQRKAKAG